MSECYSLMDASQQCNKHTFDARQRQDPTHLSVSVADTSLATDMTSCGRKPDQCLLLLATWARPLLSSCRHTCPGPGWQQAVYTQPIGLPHRTFCSGSHWLSHHKQSTEKNLEAYERSHQEGKYPSKSVLRRGNGLITACCFHPRPGLLQLYTVFSDTDQMSSAAFIPIPLYKLDWAEGTLNSANPHESLDRKSLH